MNKCHKILSVASHRPFMLTVSVYEKLGTSKHISVKQIQSSKRATTVDFSSTCPIFHIPCYALAGLYSVSIYHLIHYVGSLLFSMFSFSFSKFQNGINRLNINLSIITAAPTPKTYIKISIGSKVFPNA